MFHYFADGVLRNLSNYYNIRDRNNVIEDFYNSDIKPPPMMTWHSIIQVWNDANILNNMWKQRVESLDKSMDGYQQAFDDAINGFNILIDTLNNLKKEFDKFGVEQQKNLKIDIDNIIKSSNNAIIKSDENMKDHEDRYQINKGIYAAINFNAIQVNNEYDLFETALKDYKIAIERRDKEIDENNKELQRIGLYILKIFKDIAVSKTKPPNMDHLKVKTETLKKRNETLYGEMMILKMYMMQTENNFKQMQNTRPEVLFILDKYNKYKKNIEPKIPPKWIEINDAKTKLRTTMQVVGSL